MRRSELVALLADASPEEEDPEVILAIRRHAHGVPNNAKMGDFFGNRPYCLFILADEER